MEPVCEWGMTAAVPWLVVYGLHGRRVPCPMLVMVLVYESVSNASLLQR